VLPQGVQNNLKILSMLLFSFGIDENAIDEKIKNFSRYFTNTLFIKFINMAGAFVNLNGTTRYS
jgi:hypothetical protein